MKNKKKQLAVGIEKIEKLKGKKPCQLFGLGRLARNNWLSRIVKALFFFTARPRNNTRTVRGTTGGQGGDRMACRLCFH